MRMRGMHLRKQSSAACCIACVHVCERVPR